ncbi:MAG: PIN domain-containing protein [Polyangiaceae bacterium]|nr:PIN domain-containing protein [Polyangiaceae bacterium]
MTTFVIDTGPLVPFLNKRDRQHAWAKAVLDTIEPPIVTCEAVISEACYLLRDFEGGRDAVLALMARNLVKCEFRLASEVDAVRALMKKFSDVPMSLADACLVRITELEANSVILTMDSDFRVYRRNRRQTIPTMTPPRGGG